MARKTFNVRRIRLDRQGYTKHGRYYGVGAPLYEFELYDPTTQYEEYGELRAYDNKSAREKVKARYPEFFKKSNPSLPKNKWIPAKAIKIGRGGRIDVKLNR